MLGIIENTGCLVTGGIASILLKFTDPTNKKKVEPVELKGFSKAVFEDIYNDSFNQDNESEYTNDYIINRTVESATNSDYKDIVEKAASLALDIMKSKTEGKRGQKISKFCEIDLSFMESKDFLDWLSTLFTANNDDKLVKLKFNFEGKTFEFMIKESFKPIGDIIAECFNIYDGKNPGCKFIANYFRNSTNKNDLKEMLDKLSFKEKECPIKETKQGSEDITNNNNSYTFNQASGLDKVKKESENVYNNTESEDQIEAEKMLKEIVTRVNNTTDS